MKRSVAVALFLFVAVGAFARTNEQCRGVLTQEAVNRVKSASEDPATTFKKQHRQATMPVSVRCASKLWQELYPTERKMGLSSLRAASKASAPQGRQFTGLWACWSR